MSGGQVTVDHALLSLRRAYQSHRPAVSTGHRSSSSEYEQDPVGSNRHRAKAVRHLVCRSWWAFALPPGTRRHTLAALNRRVDSPAFYHTTRTPVCTSSYEAGRVSLPIMRVVTRRLVNENLSAIRNMASIRHPRGLAGLRPWAELRDPAESAAILSALAEPVTIREAPVAGIAPQGEGYQLRAFHAPAMSAPRGSLAPRIASVSAEVDALAMVAKSAVPGTERREAVSASRGMSGELRQEVSSHRQSL
jgi:hypothetical protein